MLALLVFIPAFAEGVWLPCGSWVTSRSRRHRLAVRQAGTMEMWTANSAPAKILPHHQIRRQELDRFATRGHSTQRTDRHQRLPKSQSVWYSFVIFGDNGRTRRDRHSRDERQEPTRTISRRETALRVRKYRQDVDHRGQGRFTSGGRRFKRTILTRMK